MRRSFATGFLLILMIFLIIMVPSCKKDTSTWKPEVLMIMKPDSGLTTQIFDFRIDVPNLPKTHGEFYIRWNLNEDSVWDDSFTAYPTTTHRFYKKGVHSVKAEILTEDGQRILVNKNIHVDQGYSAPHAAFKVDPPEGNYMKQFTFDASSTFDDEDAFSTLLFRWDFEGDGGWDTEPSSDPVAKHKYKKAANYEVKLLVTDPTRRTTAATRLLVVNLHDDGIIPDFKWSPEEATVKDTFLLDASATHHETDQSRVFTYTWDIQSEVVYGPFKEPQFKHQFWSAGMQTVTLKVTDQLGLTNSIVKEFFVVKENRPPVPKIQVSTPYGNITSNFFLSAWPSTDDVTPPTQLKIRWDFDSDGNWDTGWSFEKQLFHQFTEAGQYWITMEAEDEGGEKALTKTKVWISQSTAQTGFVLDRRDGKYYGTVKIGDQWWMSDNLDFRTDPKMTLPMLQKCYEEASGNCDAYGSLYQGERSVWYTSAGKNYCPTGWRLPTKQDWEIMGGHIPVVGGREALMVGGSLGFNARYTGRGWFLFEYSPDGSIADTLYFYDGLYKEVQYLSISNRPYFNRFQAQFYMGLQRNYDGIDRLWGNADGYFYVRCIKEE